ncbi:MAG: polysaccharide biosynthesis protein [Bacilli bacterium]|nr:polysaccharide biosynthesis protein [Bacilli bacterium]
MLQINKSTYVKKLALAIYDMLTTFGVAILAIQIVDKNGLTGNFNYVLVYSFFLMAITFVIFYLFKLYASLWLYAGPEEIVKICVAIIIIFIFNVTVDLFSLIVRDWGILSLRWCVVFSISQFITTALGRYTSRFVRYIRKGNKIFGKPVSYQGQLRIMIIGAGEAGRTLIREMRNNTKMGMVPVCLIDDDPEKTDQYMDGIKIMGTRVDIMQVAETMKIDRIIIAIPSASPQELSNIIKFCQETRCKIQTIPGLYQMIDSTNMLSKVRDVQVEDLLGRDPIKTNLEEITAYLKDKVVLVTGGGGSIGSELCRQIANSNPKQLIILDVYENNAYDIEQELKREYKDKLNLLVLIASVRDKVKIDDVFSKYHPDIVFHAAAHKHVPLMETSPNEAIKNNVFGTLNVARAADKYGTHRFIMISTDKAVNPTNIMGASKRICEMIVQAMDKKSNTEFVATRFGNVLGSNGSVIPLFKKQIAEGGPVCVTHKDIVRYFMTIPEAVSLVLQAGSYAKGGEIFVLDMGKPVRIYDLAVNLIKLSGYVPDVDIKINITGLRPGEKLYEEMLMSEEGLQETPNKLIHIGHPSDFDEENLFDHLDELYKAAYEESDHMKELVSELVPTYHITDNK